MSLSLFPTAYAASAHGASQQGGGGFFMIMLVVLVGFYFMMWRSQKKRTNAQKEVLNSLGPNDEVVTAGGIAGKIMKVDDDFVTLKIAEGVDIRIQKSSVGTVLPKGTLKGF